MSTTVSSKGQVTIPKRIRDALGLKKGTKVGFILSNGYAQLKPVDHSAVADAAGALSAYGQRHRAASREEAMEKVRKEVADAATNEGRPSRHKRSA